MAVQMHNRGWLDTRARTQEAFKEDALVKSLVTRNATLFLNKTDVDVATASKWALMMVYGSYAITDGAKQDMNHIKAVSVGELIAPVLPASYFLSTVEANNRVTRIIKYYMRHESPLNRGRAKAQFIETHNNVPEEARSNQWVEIQASITDEQFLNEYGELYVDFLLLESPLDSFLKPIELFTTVYIAVAKRGNVTDDFITKVTNGINNDLQYNAALDSDVIEKVYKFYGGHIDATNARDVLMRWLQDIP